MKLSKVAIANKDFAVAAKPSDEIKNENRSVTIDELNGADVLSARNSYAIKNKKLSPQEQAFIEFREPFSKNLHEKAVNVGKIAWDFYINSTDENQEKSEKANQEYAQIFQDKNTFEFLDKIKNEVKDKVLALQVENLHKKFEEECSSSEALEQIRKKQSEIAGKYNKYVPTIDNKPTTSVEIRDILSKSKDEKLRKSAYEARVKGGDLIAKDMIELVKMRNDFAKSKGFDNYFEYKLKQDFDVDSKKLIPMFEKLAKGVDKVYQKNKKEQNKLLKKEFNCTELKPWHKGLLTDNSPYKDANNYIKNDNQLVQTAKDIYKNMGWDVDNLPITLDLFPRENKNTHGFCFNIDTNKDTRILANLSKDFEHMDTLCHELGHAVYNLGLSDNLPYLSQDCASSAMTEAVAMMMGEIFLKEPVLKEKLNMPDELVDRLKNECIKNKADFIKGGVHNVLFEKALYENPDADPKRLWAEIEAKYVTGKDPKSIKEEYLDNTWCTVPHFLSHPAYYQNYIRADVMASQIYDKAKGDLSNLTQNTKTAEYFNKNLFALGSQYKEEETLKKFTGETFSIDNYLKLFN